MLFIHKKEKYPAICDNNMDPEGIRLSKINQTDKGRYCVSSLISGILKAAMNS